MFNMHKISPLIVVFFLLQPASALAANDMPAQFIQAAYNDASPRALKGETHLQANIAGTTFFASAWMRGRTQGALKDAQSEMSVTLDIADPSDNLNVRAKMRIRTVDDTAYFILDSLGGDTGSERIPEEMKNSLGKWMSMSMDSSLLDAAQMDFPAIFQAFDEDVVRVQRTQGKDGSSYSVTLDRSIVRGLNDLLSMIIPEAGAVAPKFNFHAVVNTDAFDVISNARTYVSLESKSFSIVSLGSSERLDSSFSVRPPANAVPIDTLVPDGILEGFAMPSARIASPDARYEARAAARALRLQTVKKPANSAKLPADLLSFGEESAPVTITEYTDYQCPFCRDFHYDTYWDIHDEYISTGKVRFVIKQYPLSQIHSEALIAAMAVQCVLDQGMENARRVSDSLWYLGGRDFDAAHIRERALLFQDGDEKEVADCIDQAKKQDVIDRHIQEGNQEGVNGTPFFVITNGKGGKSVVSGAHPFENFKEAIDALLK